MAKLPALFAAVLTASAVGLAACGGADAAHNAGGGKPLIVTSTNVYGDIVSQVAGELATVDAIIDDPTQDPHSYEATARDRLKLSKAQIVVVNGGGYDAFMTTMLKASDAQAKVIDTVAISGLPGSTGQANEPHEHAHHGHDHGTETDTAAADAEAHGAEAPGAEAHGTDDHDHSHDHDTFNEHVWYSIPTMKKLVDGVARTLGAELPDNKQQIADNARAYTAELDKLQHSISEVKKQHHNRKGAATEPVPLWLFHDMGIENITPQEFLAAVEEGNDVPPLVLKKAKEQITNKQVSILGYNVQNSGPQAEELKTAASHAGIPIVDLAETMPKGDHYISWMGNNIAEISQALEKDHAH